jgi:hypothetical protein
MSCSLHWSLSLLLLAPACADDDPGVGGGNPDPDPEATTGSDSGTATEGAETLDPDSSGTTGEPGWAEICDGSAGLRLAMVLGGGGLVANEIEREIGFRYLYVLGTCEYFVLPSIDGVRWPDARTGVMDPATEEQLSRALGYAAIADIAGSWSSESVADGSTLLVSDGLHTVACYAGCEEGPEAARALWSELHWIDTLWMEGEAYGGPLRISVIGWIDATLDELGVPWPLPMDPWSIALDGAVDPAPQAGETLLIDDPEQVATLRELRRQYREDEISDDIPNALQAYGHLTFTNEGGQDLFQLWMRDSLPIEDEAGLIPLP